MRKLGVISQERLKIEVKLLLNANRKSYMARRLVQQRMTLSDLEWPFRTSRAISAVAELSLPVSFIQINDCVFWSILTVLMTFGLE